MMVLFFLMVRLNVDRFFPSVFICGIGGASDVQHIRLDWFWDYIVVWGGGFFSPYVFCWCTVVVVGIYVLAWPEVRYVFEMGAKSVCASCVVFNPPLRDLSNTMKED